MPEQETKAVVCGLSSIISVLTTLSRGRIRGRRKQILELKRSIMEIEDQVSDLQTEIDIRIDTEITRSDQRMSGLKQKGASMEKALQKALASAEELSAVHLETLASRKKINDADIKQLSWELKQLAATALSLSSSASSAGVGHEMHWPFFPPSPGIVALVC